MVTVTTCMLVIDQTSQVSFELDNARIQTRMTFTIMTALMQICICALRAKKTENGYMEQIEWMNDKSLNTSEEEKLLQFLLILC